MILAFLCPLALFTTGQLNYSCPMLEQYKSAPYLERYSCLDKDAQELQSLKTESACKAGGNNTWVVSRSISCQAANDQLFAPSWATQDQNSKEYFQAKCCGAASCPAFDKASSMKGWMSPGAKYRTLYSVKYSDKECKRTKSFGTSFNYDRMNCGTVNAKQKLCKRCIGDVLNIALFPSGMDQSNFDDTKFASSAIAGTLIKVDSADRCANKCLVLGDMSLRIGWHVQDGPICGKGPSAECRDYYNVKGQRVLCYGSGDCTHPNNICSQGQCNAVTKRCETKSVSTKPASTQDGATTATTAVKDTTTTAAASDTTVASSGTTAAASGTVRMLVMVFVFVMGLL